MAKAWSAEEDGRLRTMFLAGEAIGAIARAHQRKKGAIRSRLVKLGLLRPTLWERDRHFKLAALATKRGLRIYSQLSIFIAPMTSLKPVEWSKEIPVHPSSGNVFADLGFADAEDMQLRADLVQELREIIARRKLTQRAAAELWVSGSPTCRRCCAGD